MSIAVVFPGQGAQYIGMGQDLIEKYPVAKKLLQEADEALAFSLSSLIEKGDERELRLTYHTQPAILAISIVCYRVLQEEYAFVPKLLAGHSLGEYTALVAANALSFTDGVRLVHQRGKLMDASAPAGTGAMAAVLGADLDRLQALCLAISTELGQPVEMANVNCPGQVVVSGEKSAVATLIERVAESGARRAIALDVSGPFHSSLMRYAKEELAKILVDLPLVSPNPAIVSNVTAKSISDPSSIKKTLALQVASPVLWEASVQHMIDAGIHTFIECGPGTVLSGLIKKTDRQAMTYNIENVQSLAKTLCVLRQEAQ